MKIRLTKDMSFNDINKYLYPVKEYIKEKTDNNMYDDWNELEHTSSWLKEVIKSINENNKDILDIYYIEDNETIIGVVFSLSGNNIISNFLNQNNITESTNEVAQLTCFHILKNYRGIGRKWLENEVLKDLHSQGIKTVFIKSSHNKAIGLYDKLGTKIGNYIGLSDHKLYQRYGYIYKIDL